MVSGPGVIGFLDPSIIARIGSMELKAKTIVEGFLHGLHRSPYKGFSVEFAEYRQYLPGDDLATIDWKVYARSDRHFVKKFEADTNLQCHLLLDVSKSMGYRSTGVSKLEYGTFLCAAIAFLMNRQRDAVGLMTFDHRIVDRLPSSARPGHLRVLLHALEHARIAEQSDVSKPLHQLAAALSRRGLVVVVSDLLDDPETVVRGLRHVKFRGMDVVVFHLVDPAESSFPFQKATRFRDLESAEEVLADPATVRDQYLREFGRVLRFYEHELTGAGIDYHQIDTAQPLDRALSAYLATRAKRH